MKPCPEFDLLLVEDVAGTLSPADAARVGAHLVGCAACRGERDLLAAALTGATLPPVAEPERRAMSGLAKDALGALRRAERRRSIGTRGALAAIATLAALLVLYAGRTPEKPARNGAAEVASLDSAAPAAPLRSGRTEEGGVQGPALAEAPRAEELAPLVPMHPDQPVVGGARVGIGGRSPQAAPRAPTSQGFAPATVGERTQPRSRARAQGWQEPDLELLWEDTAVLDLDERVLDL